MAEGLSRCFLYFLKTHAACICMSDSFPSPSYSSFVVLQLFELKHSGCLFGYKIQLARVVPKHGIAL